MKEVGANPRGWGDERREMKKGKRDDLGREWKLTIDHIHNVEKDLDYGSWLRMECTGAPGWLSQIAWFCYTCFDRWDPKTFMNVRRGD